MQATTWCLQVSTERAIKSLAYRYANWRMPVEDMMQEGRIAAWQAEPGYEIRSARLAMLNACTKPFSNRADRAFLSYDDINEDWSQFVSRDFVPFLLETLCPEPTPKRRRAVIPPHREISYSSSPIPASQFDVLKLLCTDMPAQEVADHLGITLFAVKNRMRECYRTLGVKTLIGAYNKAMRLGLIEPPCREKSR